MICHSRCMRHKIVDFRHRAQCAAGRNTQLFKCAHGPDPLSMILRQSKTNKKTFFQELLCSSKKLEYCHYLQDPWHLAATKRQTPCWHLSKMSGRSWIDRVSYTWMLTQDALSMSWIHGSTLQQRNDWTCSNDHEVILQNLAVVCKITISVNPSSYTFGGIFVLLAISWFCSLFINSLEVQTTVAGVLCKL